MARSHLALREWLEGKRETEGMRGELRLSQWVCWHSGAERSTMQTPLMSVGRWEAQKGWSDSQHRLLAPWSSFWPASACIVMEYIALSGPPGHQRKVAVETRGGCCLEGGQKHLNGGCVR